MLILLYLKWIRNQKEDIRMDFKTAYEKIYSAWMGKIIGIRLGAPVEAWTYDEIKSTYGTINDYVVDYGVFAADDDSNGPLFFKEVLRNKKIKDITAQDIANTMLNYIPYEHGFFWWGGKGISTEHTSYLNLVNGIEPPLSGSSKTNGQTMAEQIGGQIFVDWCGYCSLGDPHVAKKLAYLASSITHDQDGIEGGVYVAVMIALSFTYTDTYKIVNDALDYIDSSSTYYQVVKDIIRYYDENPDDEMKCFDYILSKYSYDHFPGMCHIIPNIAIMILALLYGHNDFTKTMTLLCTLGYDTDCNCGNVGSIIGCVVGINHIDQKWILPINDILLASSNNGYLNQTTVSDSAYEFTRLAFESNEFEIPNNMRRNPQFTSYAFDLPYATKGFVTHSARYCESNLKQENNQLKIILNNCFKGYDLDVNKITYFLPHDIYDARYDPLFSPQVFPNQTITVSLQNPLSCHLTCCIRVWYTDNTIEDSPLTLLEDQLTLQHQITQISKTVHKIGIHFEFNERVMRKYIMIQSFSIDHTMKSYVDFRTHQPCDFGLTFGEDQCINPFFFSLHKGNLDYTNLGVELKSNDDAFIQMGNPNVNQRTVEFNCNFDCDETHFCFSSHGYTDFVSLKFVDGQPISLCIRNGLNITETYKSGLIYKKSNSTLKVISTCDLINVHIDNQSESIPVSLNQDVLGMFGFYIKGNGKVSLVDCKLEGQFSI